MKIEEAIKRFEPYIGNEYYTNSFQDACKLAVEALREKIEADKNEPLTLDELRKMKGKPVWVQPPEHKEYGAWGIVRGAGEFNGEKMLFIDSDFTCHDYGRTWLAYRNELKEEQDGRKINRSTKCNI